MTFKKITEILHRWLGLISGLVVLIVSITGCLFVFHQEISRWTRSDLIYVDQRPDQAEMLPVSELEKRAAEALGVERLPFGLTTYKNPDRTWKAINYEAQEGSWTYFGSIKEYKTVYINPYNGQVAGIVNEENDFFQIVKGIHWSLLLATPIGQPIVTWSTIVFILLLITGLILWWPKRWTRSGRRNSFTIKTKSTWRRLNYDLHNVLGFYSLLLAFIIAFTGLYWAFPTAKKMLYFAGTGEWKVPNNTTKVSRNIKNENVRGTDALPIQKTYENAWEKYPDVHNITLVRPADSLAPLEAHIRPSRQTYYDENHMEFSRRSGALLQHDRYEDKNAGEKLLAMNYDIHVGAIGGIFGKVLAFFASLVCASLPVTGFIIWYSRKRRVKKRARCKERLAKRRRSSKLYRYYPENSPSVSDEIAVKKTKRSPEIPSDQQVSSDNNSGYFENEKVSAKG